MNQVIIIGNLGSDPEMRTTQDGKAVCNFSVAVNEKRGGKDHTEWFRCTAWEKTAENCGKYLSKGRQVCVQGSVSLNEFTGRDGLPKAALSVSAQRVHFLAGGRDEPRPQAQGFADRRNSPPLGDDTPF